MAAEGRSVGAHCKGLGNLFRRADGADGHAAAEGLCHGNDIRLDAVVHEAHDGAGSAPAGLDFVDEEEHVVLIAELAQAGHEFLRCGMNAALALDGLDHDGDGVFGAGVLEGLEIVKGGVGEAVGHGTEAYLTGISGLAGRGHGTEGAAVEAFLCCYDVVAVGAVLLNAVLPGHLDHGFVGLGTGVLEEDLVHADRRADLFSQQGLGNRVGVIKCLHDVPGLIADGVYNSVVAVAEGVYGDAGVEVQVGRVVFVVHVHALCVIGNEIETLISFDHVLVYLVLDVLGAESCVLESHNLSSFFPFSPRRLCGDLFRFRFLQRFLPCPAVFRRFIHARRFPAIPFMSGAAVFRASSFMPAGFRLSLHE